MECLIAYPGSAYRQLATRQEEETVLRERKEKRFSSKPLSVAVTVFSGLIVLMMTMLSAPAVVVFVFADNIQGTSGDDTLNGIDEADTTNGFEGNDLIFGEGGDDTLDGGKGDDEIHAELYDVGSGISGGSGNDKLYVKGGGGSQNGNDGNDYVFVDGGGGDLKGGEGDDVLEASGSSNYYNGGLGADTFKCSPGSGDVVEDYNPGEGDTVSADCETVEDAIPPDVQITKAVDKKGVEMTEGSTTKSHYIQITFEAADAVGIDNTQCSLDGQAFTSCTSPIVYDQLRKWTHQFTVRSTDAAGNTGEEDQFTWTVNPAEAAKAKIR